MSFQLYLNKQYLKNLIEKQYKYGYDRQSGLLATRYQGCFGKEYLQNPLGLKPYKLKKNFPLPKTSKCLREEFYADESHLIGHPLVRKAFIKGAQDGKKGKYRADIILKLQKFV